MKTHYELLHLDPAAAPEEIKRAFRQEIARYHPDKVQHLGAEFQRMAADRAAELTEAYRVLMDASLRAQYDEALKTAPPSTGAAAGAAAAEPPAAPARPDPQPDQGRPPSEPSATRRATAASLDLIRRVTVARLRDAASAMGADALATAGFDAAFTAKPKKGLFRKADEVVTLMARVVPEVDPAAVEEVWRAALKASSAAAGTVCVLLMGSRLSPARDLASAVSEQRRRSRNAGPVLVPVDVRDWEALFPPETPGVVRSMIQWLRDGNA